MSRGGGPVAALLLLALLVAACSGDAVQPADDLVSVGTEAWLGETGAAAEDPDGEATASDPTDGDPTDGDPLSTAGEGSAATPPPELDAAPVDAGADVSQIVAAMTLEQKVGQLFTVTVIGDAGTAIGGNSAQANMALYGVATPAEVVQRYHLGGVAYFDHQQGPGTSNVADLVKTADLSRDLQAAAAADTGIGLLIGTDQEGGPVVRLNAPATVFPAARSIGATGDLGLAEQAGLVTATEALALGINWIYAPVADVNVNPANPVIGNRAFGTTADAVVPFVQATARGIAAGGALPTLKHYPGHGDTGIDSHSSLPTIDHDRATLDAVDLPPFAAASGEGPVSVMVGHLAVPALDPSGRPATLSGPIIDVLRADPAAGGLGFDGLVVTDAMNMGALDGFGDAGTLSVEALRAGIDMVLMPTDLPAAYGAVLAAAQDGSLPMARIDQAVTRVLQAKASIGVLDASAIPLGNPAVLGNADHRAVREAIRAACSC
ncbi:hypothetical protein BH23ACT9_BH23ACT9_19560 [soil metagenome]